jgi:hypothetical protein
MSPGFEFSVQDGVFGMATEWSEWRPFPDPRKSGILTAPFGAGCYELRHRDGRLVLFGTAGHVAYRMTSLLPKPFGSGHRSNAGEESLCRRTALTFVV